MDVLRHAYACCRANKGAAGVDDLTFDDIEAYGREQWLGELAQPTRLRRWLCRKHKQGSRGIQRYSDEYMYQQLGLIRLPMLPQRLPWAKA
jgi:hypothetical protein